MELFCEGVAYLQTGNRIMANQLYQEAKKLDPSLHDRACELLSTMAQRSGLAETGPIYYWLGIHFEYRGEFRQAAVWYARAADAFRHIGHEKRQGRAHCNLGTVYLRMQDYQRGMEEFEMAIALNPGDGIAHFNIGMMYYRISNPGEEEHERALDSFARAMAADPEVYGPMVASRMRAHAYTWQQDLEKVLHRAAQLKQA